MKPNSLFRSALSLVFLLWGIAAYSQTVSGTVTDAETGEPLIYANVAVVGTTTGASTDFDGKYSIDLPAGATQLQFTYTGYATQTVDIAGRAVIDIALSAGEALKEVVVIGYGSVKKDDATGSVTQISTKDFGQGNIAAPEQLVMGKVAGVAITTGGGAPGGGSEIRIRGGSSLNASNNPLIIVDGIPLDNSGISGSANALSAINPNDIETFTILKDASATAIYGSRASNGVIIITTKKGKSGAVKFNYNGNMSVGSLIKTVDVLNASQFTDAVKATGREEKISLLGTADTNWQDAIFQAASGTDQNLSATGAIGGKLPFRVSLGYNNQTGLLKTSSYDRLSGSVSLNPTLLNDNLKVNFNYRHTTENNNFANQGAIGAAIEMDPTHPIYDNGSIYGGYFEWIDAQTGDPQSVGAVRNPLSLLELTRNKSKVNRDLGNIQLDYALPFVPGLRANLNMALDKSSSEGSVFTPLYAASAYSATPSIVGGADNIYTQDKENKLFDFYLNYAKELANISSRLDVTAGYSYQSFDTESFFRNQDVAASAASILQDTTISRNVLASLFGRLNYTLKDKYLLTFTLRRDGSSRFSEENRWGLFPSIAFAWNIGRENILKDSKTITDLKLRLGYGVTGQQDIGGDFPYLPVYAYGDIRAQYQLGNQYYTVLRPSGYDENIKWEQTATYNVGLDYGFLNNRLYGTIDYYKRITDDLLNFVPVAAGSNLTNYLTTNVGSLENNGLEIGINAVAIDNKDKKMKLDLGYNITFNQSEITKLTINDDPTYLGVSVGGITGATGTTSQIHSVGYAPNSYFLYKQVYDSSGKPIQGLYEDLNGDGKISGDDRYRYKRPAAPVFMGFTTNLAYGNFDFNFGLRANFGNYVYNNVKSQLGTYRTLYDSFASLSNSTAEALNTDFTYATYESDYYVENASFLRMDNITLGYRLNEMLGAKLSGRVYGTVQNVFVITKYSGLDPEVAGGVDYNVYPRPRTFLLGLNLDF
jgi:TonB-linked SusC/RagA family outer membrane protein